MNRKKLVMTAAAAAVLLGLSACTSDETDTASETTTTVETTATSGSSTTEQAEESAQHSEADVMFAQMMIPHHEQAIEMSDIILSKDDVPADVEDAAVHHPVFVVEDTQLCGLLHEVLDVLCGVVGGDTDEDEHAEAVALGDSYSVDVDGCGAGALDEEAHGYEWVILRDGRRCR